MTFEMTFFPGLSQWLKIAQTVSFSVKQNYLNSLTFLVGFSNTVNYIADESFEISIHRLFSI